MIKTGAIFEIGAYGVPSKSQKSFKIAVTNSNEVFREIQDELQSATYGNIETFDFKFCET